MRRLLWKLVPSDVREAVDGVRGLLALSDDEADAMIADFCAQAFGVQAEPASVTNAHLTTPTNCEKILP